MALHFATCPHTPGAAAKGARATVKKIHMPALKCPPMIAQGTKPTYFIDSLSERVERGHWARAPVFLG